MNARIGLVLSIGLVISCSVAFAQPRAPQPNVSALGDPNRVPAEGLQPTLTKLFVPNEIGPGSASTLQFRIDNPDSVPVAEVAFTDTLPTSPASMLVAAVPAVSSDCGGTVTATPGSGSISLVDGMVGAFSDCTITVDVTAPTTGVYMNTTSDLTWEDGGISSPATDDLTVATNRPGFSKSFAPAAIPLGGRSTLTFLVDNSMNASLMRNLTFTDNLPAGLVVASPANTFNDCASGFFTTGNLVAVPGTSVISLAPLPGLATGAVGAGATCTVRVDVVATGAGMLGNTTSDFTSFDGVFTTRSSGKASALLDVSIDVLSLRKEFLSDPVPAGGQVTLEFTINNFDRNFVATNLAFSDDLDLTLTGLVASGLPAADVCGTGSLLSGTSLLSFTGGNLPPEGTCTFSVTLDIPSTAVTGNYTNTTSQISGDVGGSPETGAAASDDLFVSPAPILTKSFTDDPVGAGDSVTLNFEIQNTSASSTATDLSFTDELTLLLPFPLSVTLPSTPCGAGSSMSVIFLDIEEQALLLSAGTLDPGASCSFDVLIDIPAGFPPGLYLNETSAITGTIDGAPVVGLPATDTLEVAGAPDLTKDFTDDPVLPGDTVTLEFTLQYSLNAASDATAIAFTDNLDAALSGLAAIGLPLNDVCGVGSQITGTTTLAFTGGTLAPGGSCSFSVPLQVPGGAPAGTHTNITSAVTTTVGGVAVTGLPATADLLIGGLELSKEFTDDPVLPGGQVTLEFTIENMSATETGTGILFTDTLSTVLPGLAADAGSLPATPCGAGSSISGTTFLIFVGGTLGPLETCTFSVTLDVPAGAAVDTYQNVTSAMTATFGGGVVVFEPADDVLIVDDSRLSFQKEFIDDPVAPGENATLRFTISNLDLASTVSDITFTDDLDATLTGLVATGLPVNDVCGSGSVVSGTSTVTLTGGTVAAGANCVFDVTVTVPMTTPGGTIATNTTSTISGTLGGLPVSGNAATDDLRVDSLVFTKAFDGPTTATGTAVLSFTIENQASTAVSELQFSDDLDSVVTGLVATGLPLSDVCGAGSSISGTGFLTFTDGNIGPGGSCTFMVDVLVPGTATAGTFPNVTSDLQIAGLPVADPATADLLIEPAPTFAKVFVPDSIVAGAISTLTFTIDNSASALAATALDFTDNLPANLVVAAPSNASTTCTGGTVTAATGGAVISYTGGSVAAGASCTLEVDVTSVLAGAYVNLTGDLTSSSGNSGTATETLTVTPPPPPLFSKVFIPDTMVAGDISTLAFTIDNGGSLVDATALDFTDNLPAGVVVASPANVSTTCTGGTLTAVPGTGVISYSGGTIAAGASCAIQADVTSVLANTYVNVTGDLTSSSGSSGTATDTLVVTPPPAPLFSKTFAPDSIFAGEISVLTFTIDNTVALVDATALDFTDSLPANLVIATPANAATTCVGGTLTAAAGSGTISYTGGTVPASSTCTISVDTTSDIGAVYTNVSGDLTSSSGNSGNATDDLLVTAPPLFAKEFSPDSIIAEGTSTLTFTIDNTASTFDATALDFTDNLPASMAVATPPSVTTTCTGGTITAVAGATTISYTGGTVGAGATCTLDVDVTSDEGGTFVNVTGDLTSSAGNSGTATDTLEVEGRADLELTLSAVYDPAVAHTVEVYDVSVTNNGPSTALNATVDQQLPVGTYFLGAEPSSVGCTVSGVQVACDLGDIGPGDTVNLSIGAFVDARFDGTLSSEALTGSDTVDPDSANDEMDVATAVAPPRAMMSAYRADGTEVLIAVAKEADETVGLVFAEAAGGGDRRYSVTASGFRTVALTGVSNVGGTSANEVAALASGFDGSVLVELVDGDSTDLLGSYPVAGSWVPIDIVSLDGVMAMAPSEIGGAGGVAPILALLLENLADGQAYIVYLDATTGTQLVSMPLGAEFPLDLAVIGNVTGSPADDLVALLEDQSTDVSEVWVLDSETLATSLVKELTSNAFPIAVEALEDIDGLTGIGGSGPEIAALQRDVTTGLATADIFDSLSGIDLPPVSYSTPLLPEAFERLDNFGGGVASELTVGGRSGTGLLVESRDAGSGAVVGSIAVAGSLLDLDLAAHSSFAGGVAPELSVLFEILGSPTEISVFDAAGGAPLFNFILP